nr:MAG TPA: hypothetical protein [Caudoviricetes sp.]
MICQEYCDKRSEQARAWICRLSTQDVKQLRNFKFLVI